MTDDEARQLLHLLAKYAVEYEDDIPIGVTVRELAVDIHSSLDDPTERDTKAKDIVWGIF